MNENETILDNNRRWIFWTGTIVLTILSGLGSIMYTAQQKQIDSNTSQIWEIRSTAVTEDNLDRQLSQVKEYIDVRMQSIESSQREITRQLSILVSDSKESQKQMREALSSIRQSLADKADRE